MGKRVGNYGNGYEYGNRNRYNKLFTHYKLHVDSFLFVWYGLGMVNGMDNRNNYLERRITMHEEIDCRIDKVMLWLGKTHGGFRVKNIKKKMNLT